MTKRASVSAARSVEPVPALLDAARAVAAERGLSQLSLRVVAERAGTSVGSISYRIGDRAAVVDQLARRETMLAESHCAAWARRIGAVGAGDTAKLADAVAGWLCDETGPNRVSALVQSELISAAYRDATLAPTVTAIARRQIGMWQTLLEAWPESERLARRIACYLADERPFALLLDQVGDYAMLQASTVRGLLRRDPAKGPGAAASEWHMRLVGLLAEPARPAWDAGDPPQGAKAAIAERVADMIIAGGLEAISHRAVAQALAMPVSSVAHHFPARRDIVLGGVEILYLRLRSEVRVATTPGARDSQPAGSAVVALGHEMALAALREPAFTPFAIDMRRRRAENVHALVGDILTGGGAADRAVTQAYVMALAGLTLCGLGNRKRRYDFADLLQQI